MSHVAKELNSLFGPSLPAAVHLIVCFANAWIQLDLINLEMFSVWNATDKTEFLYLNC